MLVDTHAHLEMERFDADRDAVVERARASGVSTIITIASNYESNDQAEAVAEAYPGVYHTVGVHPHDSKDLTAERLKDLCRRALGERVVAWGEIGLDYYRDLSPRGVQKEAFREQLRCAKRLGLPVVIHNRDAHGDTLKVLAEEGAAEGAGGVFHCFSGDSLFANRCLELGFHLSVAGPVTYPKNGDYRRLVAELPTDRLLIETDSPFLAPQAHRGRRNEPAYVRLVAEAVAEATGLKVDDVARLTARNVRNLFGIGPWQDEPKVVYRIRDSLYVNVTRSCTNECAFCRRTSDPVVKGHNLSLKSDPTVGEMIGALEPALGAGEGLSEVVLCGFGEPTLRLEETKAVARWLRERGLRVRLNTNGQGSLVHGRDVARELAEVVDACSVSLNAQDADTYEALCRPSLGREAYEAVKRFIVAAREAGIETSATVVEVPYWVDVETCRRICREELGVPFRTRRFNEVG